MRTATWLPSPMPCSSRLRATRFPGVEGPPGVDLLAEGEEDGLGILGCPPLEQSHQDDVLGRDGCEVAVRHASSPSRVRQRAMASSASGSTRLSRLTTESTAAPCRIRLTGVSSFLPDRVRG